MILTKQLSRITHFSSKTRSIFFFYSFEQTVTPTFVQKLQKYVPSHQCPWLPLSFSVSRPDTKLKPSLLNSLFGFRKQQQVAIKAFLNYLQSLKKPDVIDKIFDPFTIEHRLESVILNNIKPILSRSVTVQNIQILDCRFIEDQLISGLFIHREFNMPKECYSFENSDFNSAIVYRMKKKLGRAEDLNLLRELKETYVQRNMDMFYIEHYDRFLKGESIIRQFYQIDVLMDLTVTNENGETLKLASSSEGIHTTHVVQLESIKLQYASRERVLCDVDFVLKGNDYFHSKDKSTTKL